MSVYTVYEPPLRATDVGPDPDRFAFVRDGFSFWAFLVAALWMLWHRMWLVLVIYLVLAGGLEAGLHYAGVSPATIALVQLCIAVLVGLEAPTLRRFTLSQRKWKNIGLVSGDTLEDAERRFFDAWVHESSLKPSAPAAAERPATPSPVPRLPPASDVIGLFPDPGAGR
jgi:hypothetical protein